MGTKRGGLIIWLNKESERKNLGPKSSRKQFQNQAQTCSTRELLPLYFSWFFSFVATFPPLRFANQTPQKFWKIRSWVRRRIKALCIFRSPTKFCDFFFHSAGWNVLHNTLKNWNMYSTRFSPTNKTIWWCKKYLNCGGVNLTQQLRGDGGGNVSPFVFVFVCVCFCFPMCFCIKKVSHMTEGPRGRFHVAEKQVGMGEGTDSGIGRGTWGGGQGRRDTGWEGRTHTGRGGGGARKQLSFPSLVSLGVCRRDLRVGGEVVQQCFLFEEQDRGFDGDARCQATPVLRRPEVGWCQKSGRLPHPHWSNNFTRARGVWTFFSGGGLLLIFMHCQFELIFSPGYCTCTMVHNSGYIMMQSLRISSQKWMSHRIFVSQAPIFAEPLCIIGHHHLAITWTHWYSSGFHSPNGPGFRFFDLKQSVHSLLK